MATFTLNGEPLDYGPFVTGDGDEAISRPAQVLDVWSDDSLAAIGVVRIPGPPSPPIRPELPKSTVIARLNAIAKLTTVWTILEANPLAFSQWFAPDWPNVYCDDAGMLAVLGAAGLTADEIATVTAHG